MPPWFIDKNIGIQRFKDDPVAEQRGDRGDRQLGRHRCPAGQSADLPPPRQWPAGGWNYGTPDLIVSSPVVTVEAAAADWFGEWGYTPAGLTDNRYIKAIEVKGGQDLRGYGHRGEQHGTGRSELVRGAPRADFGRGA